MSLPGALSKFFRHLTVVHQQPRRHFTLPNVPVVSLTNYHVIGRTPGKDTCYIMAHGGNLRTDYFLDCMNFRVPQNTTVQFYHDHGDAFTFLVTDLRDGKQPKTKESAGQKLYTAGDSVQNYMLNKWFGFGGTQDYGELQEIAEEGDLVIVSPRNRWHHGGVTLKNLIRTVQGRFPGIRHFNCCFCRAIEGTTQQWNANQGWMEKMKN